MVPRNAEAWKLWKELVVQTQSSEEVATALMQAMARETKLLSYLNQIANLAGPNKYKRAAAIARKALRGKNVY